MKRPLVYVEWYDHHATQEWQSMEDISHAPLSCMSVGWLLREDARGISIYGSEHPDAIGNAQYILRPCITKFQILRKAKEKKVKDVAP